MAPAASGASTLSAAIRRLRTGWRGRFFWYGFQRWGGGNNRNGDFLRFSRNLSGRRFGFKSDLVSFDHKAQHRHDIVLADTVIERRGQAVLAFYHVA